MSSTLTWPDWMPAPQHDSFSIQPEDRRLTSETEAGAIIRKQFDTDVLVADCTLILDPVKSKWFESFEREVLGQGATWFNFPIWAGGEISYEKCRFKTRPKAGSLIGLHTAYSFSLYVSKRSNLFGLGVTELLMELSPEGTIELANLLHYILHVESPGLTIVPAAWRNFIDE